jgi:surface polysaccharide O-acyltransferase-like enzyme
MTIHSPTSTVVTAPGKTSVNVQSKTAGRLLFIDNLRVLLTIQVLLFHLMIIYAGTGSWFYEEGREDFVTGALGAWFVTVSQAYFMGLFLLVSAYFVPGAYDRKGPRRFLIDRLIRLGIPLAVYCWIVRPLLVYLYLRTVEGLSLSWWGYFPGQYFRTNALLGAGPLWFVETLLIFTVLYVVWRLLTGRRRARPPVAQTHFPGNLSIALFALLLGLASFLVRLWRPIEWSFAPLNLQLPFFAQYIALFILGLTAYRRNWLARLPGAAGRLWLGVGSLMILLFWPLALAGDMATSLNPFLGGWHWQALAYALWESFLCLGMCIGLIWAFRRYAHGQGRLVHALSRNAYAAYLVHGLAITLVALAARDLMLHPLAKFGLVSLVALPLCFGLSDLIRRLPYANRVL